MREKVGVYWVRPTSKKTLATGKTRRYKGKHRFKMYISDGNEYFATKYVGLGTFLIYNKRMLLLPLIGSGLALFSREVWLPYVRVAFTFLMRLLGFHWPI